MRTISPRYFADSLGVSESSLKRWVDAGKISAVRTAGGHRRIELGEALRFIRETRARVVRPELLDLPEVARTRPGDLLYDLLVAGDAVAVRGWLLARYLEGATIAQLGDGPIRTAMHALGELWHDRDDGIFVEHRATMIVLSALAHVRAAAATSRRGRAQRAAVAVGGAPAGDPYLVPSQLAQLVIEDAGLRTIDLGPDTPVSAFASAVAAHRPALVWLSITTALAPARARSIAAWIDQLPRSITVVVGGQSVSTLGASGARQLRPGTLENLAVIARRIRPS